MNKFKHDVLLRCIKLLNVILLSMPFAACWYWYYADHMADDYYSKSGWFMVALFCLSYIIFGRIYDAFLISIYSTAEIVYSQILSAILTDSVMYVIICLLAKGISNPIPGFLVIVGQFLLSVIWAYASRRWYFWAFPPQSTAIIYDERRGISRLIEEHGLKKKYDVRYIAHIDDCIKNIDMLSDVSTVFLSGIRSHDRNRLIKYCVANDIIVFVIPRVGDTIMSGAQPFHMFHLPILRLQRYAATPEYLFVKRALDIVVSLIALIVTSPILLITAVAIKATDGGPVLYKQCRLTKNGKLFDVLKFRSMRVDAERDGVARLSTGDHDDRITPIGRVIRKCRIDELPQLLCILFGDMSLVGPRPERPEIAQKYEQELPEFALRLQAKAGLTGYAQVYGKYNTTPYDKLQMDLMYIAHPSIMEDVKIILATIKILFVPESTEGVAEGAITAFDQAGTQDNDWMVV